MVNDLARRQPPTDATETTPGSGAVIVTFDFDGTLTARDSFTAFLRWRMSPLGWIAALLRLSPAALAYLVQRDRGRLKAAVVRVFLTGVLITDLERQAERFAAWAFDALMRDGALKAWAAHKAAGERVVIVTASPELLVAPFAARLEADGLIGTRLAVTPDGRIGPGLDGPNCRGRQKVLRLEACFGSDMRLTEAYGDSAGDTEMLARAERGYMRRFTDRPRQNCAT